MLKALLDTIKFKFDLESFFLFFVLGFVLLPVISWQSEYDTDCKEALLEIRQYLTGEEKLKYSEEELIDLERCYRSRMMWAGRCSGDAERDCGGIMEIQFCEDNEPIWITVIKFIQSLFFTFWCLILLLIISELWKDIYFWVYLSSGLVMGWYVTRWLYGSVAL